MAKRIISIVSCALFILLALLAMVITDLHDRDYPHDIGVETKFNLDFSESDLSINEAFEILEEFDMRWDMGLIKVTPDLTDEDYSQVFAMLSNRDLPEKFTWFSGNDLGKIVSKKRLDHSYPDGDYLITSKNAHLTKFEDELKSMGVKVEREDASIFKSLEFVVWERGFAAAVLASFALMMTLALFWLSLKARSRALRVLSGSPTIRIQIQDLTGFAGLLLLSASVVALVTAVYVGVFHGWLYVVTFLKVLFSIQVFVITISLLSILIMAVFAWPSATMLATRQPAVKSLRSIAIMIQALTFILVVVMAAPAWSTYKQSSDIAAEMEQWKQLADQVSISFATDVGEMDRMEKQISQIVKEAELNDDVALSYTYTQEMRENIDFGEYSTISMVNQRWIDLVSKGVSNSTVTVVANDNIPEELVQMIEEEIGILLRDKNSEHILTQIQFFQPVNGFQIPISQGGGGEKLYFTDEVLLVVVPSLYETYNDSSLTSMISTNNILFTGVTATQKLLEQHGLDVQSLRDQQINGELNVVYIAEDGILQAQYVAYVAWLQGLALIALVVAFTLASIIHAMITARLQAKNDFPLRLAGRSWMRIIKKRIIKELFVGLALVAIVLILQKPEDIEIIIMVATYGCIIVPLSHLLFVRWYFNGVSRRKI